MSIVRHNHADRRAPDATQARLSSACPACDRCADSDTARYGDFPFQTRP